MIKQAINNPYWDELKDRLDLVVDDLISTLEGGSSSYVHYIKQKAIRRLDVTHNDFDAEAFRKKLDFHHKRKDYCRTYTWAIPDPITLAFVAEALGDKAVEMGAGTGYWAYLLSQMGIDILAYDEKPPHIVSDNSYHSPMTAGNTGFLGELRGVYFPVQAGTPETLALHADRTLFLCWPPYGSEMAYHCLQHYQGKKLVYIGESEGGCTGDDQFFNLIGQEWEEVSEHKPIQWYGMRDYVTVYERIY